MVNTIFFYTGYALDVLSSLLNVEHGADWFKVFGQLRNTRGASVIEYGIMTGMMAVAFVSTLGVLGGRLNIILVGAFRALRG